MQRMKLAAVAALAAVVLLLATPYVLSTTTTTAALPLSAGAVTPLPGYDKIAADLWPATADGEGASMLVVLAEQADLGRARELQTKAAKSRYVYDTLRSVALRTQAPLRAWLDGRAATYRVHYLVNMLAVEGDRSLLLALAARPEVSRLVANPSVAGVDPLLAPPSSPPAVHSPLVTPLAVEWGVRYVNAPEVWSRYGLTGQGIIIGNQDTGIDWTHPALQPKYRGWDGAAGNHAYNWHDAIGATAGCPDPSIPCDPYDHGTHTVGTALGDDGQGNQIGVAPGSQWIGCRNMDDRGNGRPETYTECFEFLLAPYPYGGDSLTDGRPDLGAHIVSNSWGCPPQEGCDHFTLQQVVENVRAAGVLVVASAGNNGSACGSVIHPIGTYDASFSVGAVDSSGALASFSSRGPVTIDGSNRPKPDITAPGVSVRSALPGGSYGSMSGTSMAAPHVAGVAALLWSAAPSLVGDVDATEAILRETARHVNDKFCGSADPQGWPNNRFGWGYVDALAAVEAAPAQVRAVVPSAALACNSLDDTPVVEAQLTLTRPDGTEETYSAPTGVFSFTTSPGPVVVQASHPLLGVSLPQQVRLLGLQENTLALAAKRCLYLPLLLQ